jgi:leucine dehydrogenase
MSVFEAPDFDHHEAVAFFDDKASGLRAIIAIHSTALGPACGGTRMFRYATADDALTDALRLSRGMSYKSAIANLPLGGGKAVIIGDPARDKTEALFLAYANAINTLAGRYVTAMDVGMTAKDMPIIARGTKYHRGLRPAGKGGRRFRTADGSRRVHRPQGSGEASAGRGQHERLDRSVQGLGKVGMDVARRLHAEGARLVVADVNEARRACGRRRIRRQGAAARCDRDRGMRCAVAQCDGRDPQRRDDPALHARVIAGGANNQLARDEQGELLRARGVLYAPDYAINGGGIIRVAAQIYDWNDAESSAAC